MTNKDILNEVSDRLEKIKISTDRLKGFNEYFYSDIESIENKGIMDKFYALNYAIETSIKDIQKDVSDAYNLILKSDDK